MERGAVIVQDSESRAFLCPSDDGDVGYTPWIDEAGHFQNLAEAAECAEVYCSEGYRVLQF